MAGVTLLFAALALALTVGSGVVLYVLVRSEHDRRSVTDRATAETMARRDGGETGDGEIDDSDTDDGEIGDGNADETRGNHWR